ncbi:1-aminocyclopropane-1-carboxylate oxidase homolog 1 isoform X2 [Arachis hypogaea]|uniref:1-aminocyclopropane-1-carboxylate oxidase homolog 1 isoform X2 n=1 Tax=Arachis hypogaea TaxID=3818 RepID=UPI000DED6D06|nr:1-aminocyclopropane-1-carboxylate oxidase homolog 1 isoform X2 [Arachis hypogaea]
MESEEAEGTIVKMINNCDDRMSELKAFDDTKGGVKALVDGGVTKIPTMFYHPLDKFPDSSNTEHSLIPVIDLEGVAKDPITRQQVISRIREASETWGFFQVVNHGIPGSVLEEMKEGIKRFFEQDVEVKKEVYSRDNTKPFFYNSNFDLYTSSALNWRDSFGCQIVPLIGKPQDLPEVCSCAGHYYPPCPEPELTMGTTKHSDGAFLTVLLQDHIGGLQILHNDKWIDVHPVPETLVVNIGDLLQLLTNDRFKSVQHRVLANRNDSRVSIASFFGYNSLAPLTKLVSPIKELLSEDNPPKFKETTVAEYAAYFKAKGLGNNPLQDFRI